MIDDFRVRTENQTGAGIVGRRLEAGPKTVVVVDDLTPETLDRAMRNNPSADAVCRART